MQDIDVDEMREHFGVTIMSNVVRNIQVFFNGVIFELSEKQAQSFHTFLSSLSLRHNAEIVKYKVLVMSSFIIY